MNKPIFCIFLIPLGFLCFVASPVKAERKRLNLEDLKACAQDSAAFPSLLEEFNKARELTNSLKYKAEIINDKIETKTSTLAKMEVESQEEIEREKELVEKINEQANWLQKVVKEANIAVTKQNIIKETIEKKRAEYVKNCENVFFRRKHRRIVCGENGEYKNSDFCEKYQP